MTASSSLRAASVRKQVFPSDCLNRLRFTWESLAARLPSYSMNVLQIPAAQNSHFLDNISQN
jgi:hypothetical protein